MSKWQPDTRKFLTASEMDRLKDVVKRKTETGSKVWETAHTFIRLALETGLRVSEMCNLQVKDIYLDGNSFLRVVKGKGGKARNVILPKSLKDHLQAYIQERGLKPEDNLLISSHRKPFTRYGLSYLWNKCCKLAGLPQTGVHSSRHSYASYLQQSTSDLKLVQKQLGHSNISITSVYLDLTQEQISSKLDAVFS